MGNLIRTPHSEVTATLEVLDAHGVEPEDVARQLRRGGFRPKILAQLLTIQRSSFLTPPTGSYDPIGLDKRWETIDRALTETAKGTIPKVGPKIVITNPIEALKRIIDRISEFYGHEFLVWQTLCETVYQFAFRGYPYALPETAQEVLEVLVHMEHQPDFRIGCHRFHDMLPEQYRNNLGLNQMMYRTKGNPVTEWLPVHLRTLQMVAKRYLYWMKK